MLVALSLAEAVDTAKQPFDIEVFRDSRLRSRLIVDSQVVNDIFAALRTIHAVDTVADDVSNLVAECWVVGDHRRVRSRQQLGVTVHVLQAFTCQRRAASCRPEQEAAGHLVTSGPNGVSRALETEHRVEDVERNHGHAMGGVRRADSGKRPHRASLGNALVQNLTVLRFLVGQHQFMVDRSVVLAVRVVDLQRREPGVHAEGAGLIRDDRHEAVLEILIAHQVPENTHRRHSGGNLLLT